MEMETVTTIFILLATLLQQSGWPLLLLAAHGSEPVISDTNKKVSERPDIHARITL
jgi:hypothetical protein